MLLKALCCTLVVLVVVAVLGSRLRGPRARRGDLRPGPERRRRPQ